MKQYFPKPLARYEAQRRAHRLRREIIATQLANDVVNCCGPSFVDRVREVARADAVTVALSFEAARRIYDIETLAGRVNALDNAAPAAAQTALHRRIAAALRRLTTYMARNAGFDRDPPASVLEVAAFYREPVAAQHRSLWEHISEAERARVIAAQTQLVELGAPDDLARDVALLSPAASALDIADLARRSGWPVEAAALLHCAIGAEFGFDALREAAGGLSLPQHWDRLVVRRAAEDLAELQLKLAAAAAGRIGGPPKQAGGEWALAAVRDWAGAVGQPAQRAIGAFAELSAQGQWSFAKLMLISAELNALAAAVR